MSNWTRQLPHLGVLVLSAALAAGAPARKRLAGDCRSGPKLARTGDRAGAGWGPDPLPEPT